MLGTLGATLLLAGCVASSSAASDGSTPSHPTDARVATADLPHATARVHVSAVGDLILGNTPSVPSDARAYLRPIRKAVRKGSQLSFANLEGTLTTATSSKCGSGGGSQCFAFRNPPHFATAFAHTGFTILGDANNHSHDFGEAGLTQTVRSIHSAGMKQTGLPGQITYVKAGTTKVAVLAFAPYSNTADLLNLGAAQKLISKARQHAPIVVVYMHAGAEGVDAQHVTGSEEHFVGEDRGNPQRFAHMAVRAGASLVIASGPHVLRGMEFYRSHLIAYSLGNFANFHNFAGGGALSKSGILHVTLRRNGTFSSGRLDSVVLDSSGRATLGGDSVSDVRRLSREDFGKHRARFSQNGAIHRPLHH
jgi:poly-gamma-glutamate capsule biosynthesis protein CapA/YwtB (metallophosphatase superfamily)